MRGKVVFILNAIKAVGITPAYAGKRSGQNEQTKNAKDHPRLCGEKYDKPTEIKSNVGSPPPMRGKASAAVKSIFPDRITPAYAGKRLTTV